MVKRIYTGHLQSEDEKDDEFDDSSADLESLLGLIVARISEFIEAERTTLFLYDEDRGELWSKVAEGTEKHEIKEIRIKLGKGIAGTVMKTGESIMIHDAYSDPRFDRTIDEKSGFITRMIYCRPLIDSRGNRIGVIQLLNKKSGDFSDKDNKLLDALCSQALIAIENAQLYHHVKVLREAEIRLNEELKDKQQKLQDSFLRIEQSNNELKAGIRRESLVRSFVLLAVAGIVCGLGFYAYSARLNLANFIEFSSPEPVVSPGESYSGTHTVATRTLSSSLYLSGTLAPFNTIHVASALDGKVSEIHFEYGGYVEKGTLVARIDTTDLQVQHREAQADLIRAENELNRLKNWEKRQEVTDARRALLRARMALEKQQRDLKDTEKLLGLGIIPASEYESATEQLESIKLDFQASEESLETTLDEANEESIRIADFEVKNAQLKVQELEQMIGSNEIYAPISGIIILPGSGLVGGGKYFGVGDDVFRGDVMLSIGDMTGLRIDSNVDEIDVHKIRNDQAVVVSGEAFPNMKLNGRISYISSQALAGSGSPIFEISVDVTELTPEERGIIRLGMTVDLDVEVYRNDTAIMIPLETVFMEDGRAYVLKKAGAAAPERVAVTTGITNVESIEVEGEIAAGDEIFMR